MGEPNCNWQDDEKIQLCDSWARVTVCPIIGKCITSSKLWDKIFVDYVENWRRPPTSRSAQACQSQFRTLKKELKDWHNAQVKARRNIASDTNLMDEMNQAQTNYMKKHPKKFDKWACWEKVKHHPSFVDTPSNARPLVSYSTPSIDVGNESPIDLEDDIVLETPSSFMPRTMGQKRAKEAMRKGKKAQDAAETFGMARVGGSRRLTTTDGVDGSATTVYYWSGNKGSLRRSMVRLSFLGWRC
ncbi:hypothetical protein ACLB2K_026321 [Fragaria x ananassa]